MVVVTVGAVGLLSVISFHDIVGVAHQLWGAFLPIQTLRERLPELQIRRLIELART